MRKVGREVWRVLRDDGTWWLNLGDCFSSGNSGQTVRDSNGGMPTTPGQSFTQKATRANCGRKPMAVSKNLIMIPQRVALALQADGWIVRAQIPWVKASCMPESVRDRPTVAHEYVFLLAKSQRYFWDVDAVRMPLQGDGRARGKHSRYADGADAAIAAQAPRFKNLQNIQDNPSGRNLRTSDFFNAGLDEYERHLAHVRENGGLLLSPDGDPLAFMVNPVPSKLAHFAMWPPRLVAPMIKASTSEKGCCLKCGAQWQRVVEKERRPTRPGHTLKTNSNRGDKGNPFKPECIATTLGFSPSCDCNAGEPIPCRVLDPFCGSGTTMQVAEALGRDSWGVELMKKNIPIIGERMKTKLDPETMKPAKPQRVRARQSELA
jgi:hypothetical protein